MQRIAAVGFRELKREIHQQLICFMQFCYNNYDYFYRSKKCLNDLKKSTATMLQILKNSMNSCSHRDLSSLIHFQTTHTHTYTLSSPPTVTMHSEQPRGLKLASIASPCCGWLSGILLHSLTISRTNGSFSICSRKQLESNPETHSADITSFMWTCRRGQRGWGGKMENAIHSFQNMDFPTHRTLKLLIVRLSRGKL